MPDPLSGRHRHKLEISSAITPQLIAARGYYTEEDPAKLVALGFNADQAKAPALVIPMHGVDSEVVSYQIRPDEPRLRDGKAVKYESLPRTAPRLDIPPGSAKLAGNPEVPCWITEGVLRGDALYSRGAFPIALAGVWSWRGTNAAGGTMELSDWDRIAIKGRIFYLAFDSDVVEKPQVRAAMRRLAAVLKRRGAKDVRPLRIPAINGDKTGIDDYFAAGGVIGDLLSECVDKSLISADGIVTNNRPLPDVTQDALEALVAANEPPAIFVRAGELVRVETDERSISKIAPLTPASLRGVMARSCPYVRMTKDGPTDIAPPKDVVEDLASLGHWPEVPPIVAITRAPVLAPDGCLSQSPGYCPSSRFFIASQTEIPDWPGDARSAAEWLINDVLCDFPFAGDPDRAHALALMLLPIVRPSIDGPTPLHLIDAPVQGSGKSLLARVLLMPTCGNAIGATSGSKDEEEWRKKIASSLLEGRSYVFFDNLSRKVDSDSLAGVLTSTEWNDRALSTMRNINVPVRCAWVATANNADLSRDILRRTVWTRLDPNVERPEDRSGYRHPDIEVWVGQHRTRIISALCGIVRSWVEAGSPPFSGRSLGSFEVWSKKLGGILEVAGVTGFLGNIEQFRSAAGSDDEGWLDFYDRWDNHFGTADVRAGDLLGEFEADEVLAAMLGDKGEQSRKNKLGFLLRKRVGVVVGKWRVERAAHRSGSAHYRLALVEPNSGGSCAGVGGSCVGVETNSHDQNQVQNVGVVGVVGVNTHPTRIHAPAHAQGETLATTPQLPQLPPSDDGEVIL